MSWQKKDEIIAGSKEFRAEARAKTMQQEERAAVHAALQDAASFHCLSRTMEGL